MAGRVILILRRWRRDERGATVILFAIIIAPLVLVAAVAVDLSQILTAKRQLAAAVDSAALTLGHLSALNDANARAKAEAYVRAHYDDSAGRLTNVTVKREGKRINVTAIAEIPMTFLRVAGYGQASIAVNSEAIRDEHRLEVVLVLDNTGSMAGRKMTSLKRAATMLVDTLLPDETSDQVKVGLVPFAGAVNVGANMRGAFWLDEDNPSALNNENITDLASGVSLFSLFDAMQERTPSVRWGGCVRARVQLFDTVDAPPDPADSRTLFTPYFAPDEAWYGYNDYIGNRYGAVADQQTDATKYGRFPARISATTGPNAYCPKAPLQPLTNDKATITAAMIKMEALGNTVIPEGLMWGWRVLSPEEPFTEGASYDDTDTVKAIVLMTDGQNDVAQGVNAPNGSVFSAYGYRDPPRHLGVDATTTLDAKLAAICENIKAIRRADGQQAVTIYGIAFGNPPGGVKRLMASCASGARNYFDSPTEEDLQSAFHTIAHSLKQLRISM